VPVAVAVAGAGKGGSCEVVLPELADRTGDATPSLDEAEKNESSHVSPSTPPKFVRKAGFSELSMKWVHEGGSTKLNADVSLEGEDVLEGCSASYQEKLKRSEKY
jgi:hypothetical protein